MNRNVEPGLGPSARWAAAPALLHEFFARSARRWPDKLAIDVPPGRGRPQRRTVSYRELQCAADRIARMLTGCVGRDRVVAILLPRTTEGIYAAQLAVLQSGAAYTGIDPVFPDAQLAEILQDADAAIVLTDADGRKRLEQIGWDLAKIREIEDRVDLASDPVPAPATPPAWLTSDCLAYVIYTSGTTGHPKGVMIEHRSIANLVASDMEEFRLGPGDRVAQGSSPAYDSSIEEMWLALAAGATLVVLDDEVARLGPDLIPWLQNERITVLCPPPTLLRATGCEHPHSALPELRLLYVGGEALPRDVADRWAPGRRLENGYGPTECSVTALRTRIDPGADISIGRPVAGLHAWVLDDALQEVREGEPGELCLGGIGLARGYHNRPELTQEKFPSHPRLGRIYRTGDLVHRQADGAFFYHGRLDAQVKLRGYRVELEAIEARLMACAGVREAVCGVQVEGTRQMLVGFVVPFELSAPPSVDRLLQELRSFLPAHMVPAQIGFLELVPRSVAGKINRRQLPRLAVQGPPEDSRSTAARTPLEEKLMVVFRQVFENRRNIAIDDDFFTDLGGDSLGAASAISLLRNDPTTSALAVRDVYEVRTVAGLAQRLAEAAAGRAPAPAMGMTPRAKHPGIATLVQGAWLWQRLVAGSAVAYAMAFLVLPLLTRALGWVSLLTLGPVLLLAGLMLYAPAAVIVAVGVKKMLIGRYKACRVPVFSSFYVRHWIVQQAVKVVPWWLLEGTEFQCIALRALGAKIGQRVHLHRGVHLFQGGWDLLEVGDDVSLNQDASLRLMEMEDGQLVFGGIRIGDRCTVEVHAGLGRETRMDPDSCLAARSSLEIGMRIPTGARWDGIPAQSSGQAPSPPPTSGVGTTGTGLSPVSAGVVSVLARVTLLAVLALPAELVAYLVLQSSGTDQSTAQSWLVRPTLSGGALGRLGVAVSLATPLTLTLEALVCRALGRVSAGVMNRWSLAYIPVWLKAGLVDSAGRWLYGTLFWPHWLRWAGMKVGPGCELSGLIDTIPEMVEIGARTFCADGIYLGGPRIHQGTVTIGPVTLGEGSFIGNGAVIAGGQSLPPEILVGVCTVADAASIRPGTSWFGQPPFELPHREVVDCDRRLTHDPSWLRYANRLVWEAFRFGLPVVPVFLMAGWYQAVDGAAAAVRVPWFLPVVLPLITLATVALPTVVVLSLKWILLGRVKPGVHALWSCWASRWDFVCMAWSFYAIDVVSALEGTLLLNPLLRAAGAHIGHRAVLAGGFAEDLPDPDMLHIADGATVDCTFQAHTFEDRVLKIGRVTIGENATVGRNVVLLYGAEIGARTRVAPHSVVMKHERLLPDQNYIGFPTRIGK